MTTHLTKIWWDLNKHKLVEQAIPEAEIYKREWVGLTDEEKIELWNKHENHWRFEDNLMAFTRAIEQALKEKNHG